MTYRDIFLDKLRREKKNPLTGMPEVEAKAAPVTTLDKVRQQIRGSITPISTEPKMTIDTIREQIRSSLKPKVDPFAKITGELKGIYQAYSGQMGVTKENLERLKGAGYIPETEQIENMETGQGLRYKKYAGAQSLGQVVPGAENTPYGKLFGNVVQPMEATRPVTNFMGIDVPKPLQGFLANTLDLLNAQPLYGPIDVAIDNAIAGARIGKVLSKVQLDQTKQILKDQYQNYVETTGRLTQNVPEAKTAGMAVPEPKGKEPWELTKQEWENEYKKYIGLRQNNPNASPQKIGELGYGTTLRSIPDSGGRTEYTHKDVIQKAISEGKPVPPEVLKDYPALAKSTIPEQPISPTGKTVPKVETPAKESFDLSYDTIKQAEARKASMEQAGYKVSEIEFNPEKQKYGIKIESKVQPETPTVKTEVPETPKAETPPVKAAEVPPVKPYETIEDLANAEPKLKSEIDDAAKKAVDEVASDFTPEEKVTTERILKKTKASEGNVPPEKPPADTKHGYAEPDDYNIVDMFKDIIKKARRLNQEEIAEAELMRHEERVQRVAQAYQRLRQKLGEGSEGLRSSTGSLKGEYPNPVFQSPVDDLTTTQVKQLENIINKAIESGKVQYFKGLDTGNALSKIMIGEMPTEREIGLLEEMFGADLAREILKKQSLGRRVWREFVALLNLPRAFLSSFDLSAPFRQGIVLMTGQPKEFWASYGKMFGTVFSEKNAKLIDDAIKNNRFWKLLSDSDLYIAPLDSSNITRFEEAFMTKWASKIPGIKQSNRAYVSFLNKLRADTFYSYAAKWEEMGVPQSQYKALAKFINWATGRGPLPKSMQGSGNVFNAMFFSPRFASSRLAIPLTVLEKNPAVRNIAIKNLASFVATGVSVLSLIKMTGAGDVELDPRSTDFGKIRVGDTRYDFWGGFQQWARTITQVATGQRKTTTTGDVIDINRMDTVLRFLRSKESPIFGLIYDLLAGKDMLGQDLGGENIPDQIRERLVPMVIQDIWDAYEEYGMAGVAKSLPAVFGLGTQTYKGVDWDTMQTQLGQPKVDETAPFSINGYEKFTTKDYYSDAMAYLKNTQKADMDDKYGFTPLSKATVEARDAKEPLKWLNNNELYQINADSSKGDTYKEFYNQWQQRKKITDETKLAEFDKKYPDAEKGNMSLRRYDLLRQYHALTTEKAKVDFLKANPEIKVNQYVEYLEQHPADNAKLAIFGQAKLMSEAAYNEAVKLLDKLDIPDSAVKDFIPPKEISKQYFKVPSTRRDEIWNMPANVADQFVKYCDAYYSDNDKAQTMANKVRDASPELEKWMIANGYWKKPEKTSTKSGGGSGY